MQDVQKRRGRGPLGLGGVFGFRQIRDGEVIDEWQAPNIVPNGGLDDALDVWLSGGSQDTTWFVGLKGAGAPAAGDTMASHASWSEDQNYSEGARQAWSDGGVSGQSVDNSASPAAFSINATTTIDGAFLTGDSTKGGTTGILAAVADFASSKSLNSGDTLEVTYTITSADDGV